MTVGKKSKSIYLKIAIILTNIFGFVFLFIGMSEDIFSTTLIGGIMLLSSIPAMVFFIAGNSDKILLEDDEFVLKQENGEHKLEMK